MTIKVFLNCRKNMTPIEEEQATRANKTLSGLIDHVVYDSRTMDWPSILGDIGGYRILPDWIARNFDVLVLIEGIDEDGVHVLGRSQTQVADEFCKVHGADLTKVFRDEKFLPVSGVSDDNGEDYNTIGRVLGLSQP